LVFYFCILILARYKNKKKMLELQVLHTSHVKLGARMIGESYNVRLRLLDMNCSSGWLEN